ncbi:hypothetical protein LIER_04994 [Lithospermum erythrorhizon]|uniref:Uncharacterized protein n=1 Tax=Lithospermum erythrorhizon TaxID=34254 RepID=A0AAV3P0Q0_LITER
MRQQDLGWVFWSTFASTSSTPSQNQPMGWDGQDNLAYRKLSKFLFLAFCLIYFVDALLANASEETGIYEIKKGDFSVKVTNYGARIVSVFFHTKMEMWKMSYLDMTQ